MLPYVVCVVNCYGMLLLLQWSQFMRFFWIHPLSDSGYQPNTTLSLIPSVLEQYFDHMLQQGGYPPLQRFISVKWTDCVVGHSNCRLSETVYRYALYMFLFGFSISRSLL